MSPAKERRASSQRLGLRAGLSALALIAVGCTSVQVPAATDRAPGAPLPAEPAKTITIAAREALRGFAPWNVASTGGGTLSLVELHSNALVSVDSNGNLEARLAARLPSFDEGTMEVLADGRMRATWNLRRDAVWQDGAPFTAHDVVLGWQVSAHPEIPVGRSPTVLQMESIEATDRHTAVITWKTTFFKSLYLGPRDHLPLPSHLLTEAFNGDKATFQNLPYWTTEYLHLGPFRLVDFGLGERMVFERFDSYVRGRPRVHTIIVQSIGDENAVLASLLAGTVDIATEGAMAEALAARLRDEWMPSGQGKVAQRQGNWRFLAVQLSPDFQRTPELRDVRARRSLYAGIDREALREAIFPGFADTEADSFMPKSDPRFPLVGRPFARYRYDPTTAMRELAELGWRRGPDGKLSNLSGDQVRVHLRGTGGDPREVSIVAQDWRRLGIEVTEELTPPAFLRNNEFLHSFPGMEISALSKGDTVLRRVDSRLIPTPQTRYAGSNSGQYVNPTLDALIDKLYATVELHDQGILLRQMGEILAADLPLLPIYFGVILATARKGIHALDDFSATETPGFLSRNAHLWDRD